MWLDLNWKRTAFENDWKRNSRMKNKQVQKPPTNQLTTKYIIQHIPNELSLADGSQV